MKPSHFEYIAAENVEEAVDARAQYEDSVVLAGGQSLVPTLNFRLSNPSAVIDLRRIPDIVGVEIGHGWVRIGAMTRQRDLELNPRANEANGLLRAALHHVAHPVIRNRGTVGGSIAHADPSAELPCLLATMRGQVVAVSPSRERVIPAAELFDFIVTTSLEPDEIITEVRFPVLPPGAGWSFNEFSRRHGDFALAGVATVVTVDGGGEIASVRAGASGVSTTPVVLPTVEEALVGAPPEPEAIRAAAELAADAVTVDDDPTVSADYRRHLLVGLTQRSLTRSINRAKEGASRT